jgi:hypothetical protein
MLQAKLELCNKEVTYVVDALLFHSFLDVITMVYM